MRQAERGDLTQGAIGRGMLLFALPFLGSSLIQQLYNTVDLIFVGRLLGTDAAAAVGAGSLLITLVLGFFTGMSVGVSVSVSHAYGAGNQKELHDLIHCAAGLALTASALLILFGIFLTPAVLRLMNTPEDIMDLAVAYIRIYFLSMLPMVFYNIGSGILRAFGNSRSPMNYQLIGGIANVAGNAFFLCVLHMGVKGVALASLVSQMMAAVFTVGHLMKPDFECRLRISDIALKKQVCGRILKIGIPAAIQSMVITLSNLIVQAQINSLGIVSIAAFTAYFKVENFVYLPIMAFGQANTTFCGQNYGAGKWERMRKGTGVSILMGILVTVTISTLLLTHGYGVFSLFSQNAEVIELGIRIAQVTFPFYFIYVFLEGFSGALRGTGKTMGPMAVILVNMCGIRMLSLWFLVRHYHSAEGVAGIYPITWITTAVCLGVMYWRQNKKRKLEIG